MPVNFDEYVVETPKKTIDFDSYQVPSKISFDDYQVDEVSKGLELAYPSNLEAIAPEIQVEQPPGTLDQVLNIPKVFRTVGAETGLTTAGGVEASRAKALREQSQSPVGLEGRLITQSGVPRTAEERLANAIDRANVLSSERADRSAQEFLDAASNAPEEYGLDPRLETGLITQATRGLAKGAGMYAVAVSGGIPALAVQGSSEAFGAAKQAGKSDDEADKEATRALIGLALFAGANKAVASGIAKYLGNTSKLRTFLVQTLGQAAGNEATSRAISAYEAALDAPEGKRADAAVEAISKNDAATIAQNLGFALMGGMQSTRNMVVRQRNELQLESLARENTQRAETEAQRTERIIAEQNAEAARLGEQRKAQGAEFVQPEAEALSPEQRARATAAPPIVTGEAAPSAPQQGRAAIPETTEVLAAPAPRQDEVQVDIEAGTVKTPDGRTVTVDETGVTEVVPGSPKDISTELLVPKKGEPDAVQKQSPDEGVLRPETTGEEGVGLPGVGTENVVAQTTSEKTQLANAPIDPRGNLSLREWIEKRVSEGRTREEAQAEFSNQKTLANKWLDELPTGTVVVRPDNQGGGTFVKEADGTLRNTDGSGSVHSGSVLGFSTLSPKAVPVETPPGPPPPVEPVENRGRPPLPQQTGIRNAIVDQNRVAQGLPPRMEILRKTFGNEWVRAMEMVEKNPNSGSILVSEIAKTPRALTPTENALLLHEQVTRENNYNQALREVNEATTEADRVAAEAKLTFARDQNQEIYDAGQNAGTAAGQDLAFRKMLANRDYSLASIETELTALKQPKTPQEAKAVQAEAAELHSRIKQAEERARVAEEKLAQAQGHEEWLKLQKIARSESSAARKEGKSILDRIISTGEQAQKRIRERNLKAMREGVRMQLLPFNILDFPDHVLVGAGYIAKGVKTLADFTKRFTDDFGPEAEPHAPRVFEAASKYHEEAVSRVPKTETVQQAAAKDAEGNLNPQVVYDIARAHVNAGTQGFEPTMQATLATLKSKHPDLTMREVRDVFSGYGKVTRPSQAADKVKLSEYRELARIASGIEDALKGKAPLKSGFQRNKPTEQIRSDLAKLKRAMEENGIEVTSPEQQLANAERSATTRLQNTIESLERQIATKTRDLPASRKGVDTPEIRKLKQRVDDLRTTLDSLVPSPGISEGQRNTNAIKAVQKSIEALDQQIKSGNLAPKNVPRGIVSPELEALRSERDAMRRFIVEKRNEAKTKRSPEEIALDRYKKSLATRTKEIQDRIAKNDYVKRPRKETALDKEALEARFEYQKAKDAFEQKAFEYDLSRRGAAQKAYDTFLEVLNTSRSIMTSFDVSAPLRQGAFITLAHPIRSLKNFPGMFRAFASDRAAFELQEILTDPTKRPNASLYRSSGLDLTDIGTNVSRRKMEEAYQSRFARKIPIVAGSQRAYTTFLNQLRADSFDAMVKNLAKGGKVTDQEAKAIASFINGATGRVKFPGQLEQSTQFLNSVFFAPKYVASRLKLLADPITGFSISTGFKGKGTARVRKALAVEYGRFLTGAAIVLGLARLGGAEIEEDPRSSDFLSIKMGNTRLDILGGLKQIVTLAARMRTGENKSLKTGRIEKINPVDAMDKFVEYKLAPVFSTTRSLISGKDPVGQPITKTGAALQLVTPLPFGDIIDAMVEQGIPRGTAISIVSLFGASMSTFDARRRERVARQPWEEVARDFRKISEKPMEGQRGF